jgi:hypothetical protein
MIYRNSRKNLKYIQDSNRKLITVLEYVSAKKIILLSLVIIKKVNYYRKIYIRSQGGLK